MLFAKDQRWTDAFVVFCVCSVGATVQSDMTIYNMSTIAYLSTGPGPTQIKESQRNSH